MRVAKGSRLLAGILPADIQTVDPLAPDGGAVDRNISGPRTDAPLSTDEWMKSGSDAATASSAVRVPVRFFQEQTDRTWGFVVELPAVIGGGYASQEDAARRAVDAIVRASKLRGLPPDCEWRVMAYLEAETSVSPARPALSGKSL